MKKPNQLKNCKIVIYEMDSPKSFPAIQMEVHEPGPAHERISCKPVGKVGMTAKEVDEAILSVCRKYLQIYKKVN